MKFTARIISFIFFLFFIFLADPRQTVHAINGDANGDGKVDGLDYVIWLNNYNQQATGAANGDFDNNGTVDGLDYVIWLNNYNQSAISPTPTQAVTVSPSPTPVQPTQSTTGKTKIAVGTYPAVAVDGLGNAHIVYEAGGKLKYRKYTTASKTLGAEEDTGITQSASYRNDPDVAFDSQNRPHVIGGTTGTDGGKYAFWNGSSWVQQGTFNRDTALDLDKNDNVYVVQRGGSSGGYLGLFKKAAGASIFTSLPDPDTANSLPKGENDHVYGDIAASRIDNSLHVVYRHGPSSAKFSYRGSTNGTSWVGGGVSADDTEAPSVAVSNTGLTAAASGNGTVFTKSSLSAAWSSLGQVVTAGSRKLPSVSFDNSGNLYVGSWGGKFNAKTSGGTFANEKTLTSLSGKAIGFVRVAGAANTAFAVWEEGDGVHAENDNQFKNFDIVFAQIDTAGNIK